MRQFSLRLAFAAAALSVSIVPPVQAQLATRPAAEWVKTLEAPERLASLKVDEVVARLGLKPGDVVADLGAGTGPFEVALARAVTPKGKVYAVDVDRGFFDYISQKAQAAGVSNVQTVLGEFTDPKLPSRDVDVAFFHDVLHHIQDRAGYMKSLMPYLKPSARIVVIDYLPAKSPHAAQPELVVSPEQTAAWLAGLGFHPTTQVDLFTDKWYVVYSRH
jgi:cyclopropane fatty-acyl-phospholipid synthase-like methyltransferase